MKAFIPALMRYARIAPEAVQLLENDVRLHFLLRVLVADPACGPLLVFKGGTCLIKCYLEYPRFSVDLDFTWRSPPAWAKLGAKELRRALRPVQRDLEGRVRELATKQGLTVGPAEYGQSNKRMTLHLGYESLNRVPTTIKLQFNFIEPRLYDDVHLPARSLLQGAIPPELAVLNSDLPARYAEPIDVLAYDAREIVAEKGRAILTRTAAKPRDVLDLFLIERHLGHRIEDHEEDILVKTRASLEGAQRYRDQLARADERFEFLLQEETRGILLQPIDDAAFRAYRERAIDVMRDVAAKLS